MAIESKQDTARNRVDDVIHAFISGLKLEDGKIDANSLSFLGVMGLNAESFAEQEAIFNGCYMHVAERLGHEEAYRKHRTRYRRAARWL